MSLKLDGRSLEQLTEQIGQLAAAYTPEWRFNQDKPDVGSVIAELFAQLMTESIEVYNRTPERCLLSFLEALGTHPLPGRAADGYVSFRLAQPDMPQVLVAKGTALAADVPGKDLINYQTTTPVSVVGAEVTLIPDEQGASWYLRFDRPIQPTVVSLLFLLPTRDGAGGRLPIWEYQVDGQWQSLMIEDGTAGFTRAGIVRFEAVEAWAKSWIFGQEGYWIHIAPGDQDRNLSFDTEVRINAVEVCAAEAGAESNLPAGCKWKLLKQAGYVSKAENPDVIYGGTDQEEDDRAVARGCARNRHQFRAVTPGDFERLVFEICPEASLVTCFAGCGGDGQPQAGAVTVVVITTDWQRGARYFYTYKRRIIDWLRRHMEETLFGRNMLSVVMPVTVQITVICVLYTSSYDSVLQLQGDAPEALRCFLDWEKGNYHRCGWELGKLPEYEQIKNCLLMIPGIRGMRSLRILYRMDAGHGMEECLWETVSRHPYTLPEAGVLKISVTADGGSDDET